MLVAITGKPIIHPHYPAYHSPSDLAIISSQRGGAEKAFDYVVPTGRWVHVALTCSTPGGVSPALAYYASAGMSSQDLTPYPNANPFWASQIRQYMNYSYPYPSPLILSIKCALSLPCTQPIFRNDRSHHPLQRLSHHLPIHRRGVTGRTDHALSTTSSHPRVLPTGPFVPWTIGGDEGMGDGSFRGGDQAGYV